MTQPFEWIKGIGKEQTSWCSRCIKETQSTKDKNIVYCKECWKIKGVIDSDEH